MNTATPKAESAVQLDLADFPSTERIYEWISYLTSLGHRRTGTPEGRRSAEYLAMQLRSFGIAEVNIETAPTPCPVVHHQELRVGRLHPTTTWVNGTGRSARLGRFQSNLPAGTEVVYLGAGWESDFDNLDVKGKIVLCDIEFLPMTKESFTGRVPRAEVYDPDGTLQQQARKYDIYSPNNWPANYFHAQHRGAVGFIGVLRDYMDADYYNEDYTENGLALGASAMAIPALWVSRTDGNELVAAISAVGGSASASLSLDVEYELHDALNVHGVLPGQSSEIILVHSHHDAVYAGAVQDASGVSEVLALAEYFAGRPLEERPKTLMFAFTDTHFTDYVGHDAFIEARKAARDDIILDVVIEHVGKEIELDDTGSARETGLVEPRLLYVSDESGLLEVTKDAFRRNGLGRTYFLPVATGTRRDGPYEFRADEVISDAYSFAEAGIPVVSVVSGQMYLFHPSDTIDRIAVDELRPVGLAFAEITAEAAHRL